MAGVVEGQVLDPVVATFPGDCARARVRRVERTVRQFLEGGEVGHPRHRLRVAREPSARARLVAGLAGGAPPPIRALLRLADAHAPDAADFPPLPVPARVSRVDPVAVGLRRGAALPHGAGAPVEPRARVGREEEEHQRQNHAEGGPNQVESHAPERRLLGHQLFLREPDGRQVVPAEVLRHFPAEEEKPDADAELLKQERGSVA